MNSAEEILEQLFLRDIVKHSIAHDFVLLRNIYYSMNKFYKKRGKLTNIKHLLLRPKINAFYKIVSANTQKNISVGKILAETFLIDSKSVPFVAKISDKGLESSTYLTTTEIIFPPLQSMAVRNEAG